MYKNVLQNIENIQVWPVISFVIFFLFFILLLWWVIRVDKKYVDEMGQLPLKDHSENNSVENLNQPS
jgi:cytochrome c oxidase cbb3-type subunit IV